MRPGLKIGSRGRNVVADGAVFDEHVRFIMDQHSAFRGKWPTDKQVADHFNVSLRAVRSSIKRLIVARRLPAEAWQVAS